MYSNFASTKLTQIMKSGMHRVQVPPFGLSLRQDKATASRNPPEQKSAACRQPPGPYRALVPGPGPCRALVPGPGPWAPIFPPWAALWGAPPVQFTLVIRGPCGA